MQRKIDEDVDFIGTNQFRYRRIVELCNVVPTIRERLKLPGHVVLIDPVGITKRLKLLAIALAQDRQDVSSDDVITKIAGHITNLQGFIGRANVSMWFGAL